MSLLNKTSSILFPLFLCCFTSCKKFVGIEAPRTDLVRSSVFTSDETANAAIVDIYYQMSTDGFANGSVGSISFLTALSSDELVNFSTGSGQGEALQRFNDNSIHPSDNFILSLWKQLYLVTYKANAVIEGLTPTAPVTNDLKKQLIGEAKFIRAFSHFYLVNLYGDIPLVLTTDYRINREVPRASKTEVYRQIIVDLKDAQDMLKEDYSLSDYKRVRANKSAATALLARVYLYTNDWVNAETQASAIISNSTQFELVPSLDNVFLGNSKEAIFQISRDNGNARDATVFGINSLGVPNYAFLRQNFIDSYEAGDKRRSNWIDSSTYNGNKYFYSKKYKAIAQSPITEYSMVLRLAEQYLIRAEARAQQNNLVGAQDDVNQIRTRANLPATPAADKTSLLIAIEHEKRVELFGEWGHRWFDLKRTNKIDGILGPLKVNWQPYKALYPIPESQILNDPAMANAQNPGY